MTSLARVQNFSISLDGFGTGEGQNHDAHFGHAGDRLHQWMFATRWWEPSGSGGVDDAFAQKFGWGSAPRSVPGSSAIPDGTRTRSGRARGVPTRRSIHRSSSSPITRARPSRWRAARRFTSSTCRLTRHSRLPARLRTARTYASAGVPRGPRLPCCRAHRPHAHRGGPDPARPRRTPLGRTGGHREGLSGRGHLLAQRSHACDVHSCVSVSSRRSKTSRAVALSGIARTGRGGVRSVPSSTCATLSSGGPRHTEPHRAMFTVSVQEYDIADLRPAFGKAA